jgi:hypothetical protein
MWASCYVCAAGVWLVVALPWQQHSAHTNTTLRTPAAGPYCLQTAAAAAAAWCIAVWVKTKEVRSTGLTGFVAAAAAVDSGLPREATPDVHLHTAGDSLQAYRVTLDRSQLGKEQLEVCVSAI